jgi:hypothetical protein
MLLTCGCSFVWGDELQGCYEDPPTHWRYTFTHHLAKFLKMDYVNLANCGNGNDKIFRDTIAYLTDPTRRQPTHMVILWSSWQRTEMAEPDDYYHSGRNIQRHDSMTQFSPERVHNILPRKWGAAHAWFNSSYDVRTDILRQLPLMIAMQEICDLRGIKLIQGAFHDRMMDNVVWAMQDTKHGDFETWKKRFGDLLGKLRDESRIGFGKYETLRSVSERLKDIKPHSHPGEDSHSEYAKLLFHMFNSFEPS